MNVNRSEEHEILCLNDGRIAASLVSCGTDGSLRVMSGQSETAASAVLSFVDATRQLQVLISECVLINSMWMLYFQIYDHFVLELTFLSFSSC